MATVAELRMDVDSRPVKNAGRDLDQLAVKADRTERATNKLGDGSRKASRGVAELARETANAGRNVGGLENSLGGVVKRLAVFTAGVVSIGAALRGLGAGLQAADDFRALDNRIKLVTDSAEEFAHVQSGLIDISRRTFSSISGTVQAYQRMAGATDRLGISQDRLLSIAETVNKAVALSGATSQAAEASLIQFGQALSNNFQASAQEINSLNEQVFALSDAIARGITKITGVETFRSDLKKMAEDGKLSSELVIRALEAVKGETDATFNGLDRTFAQVAQRLKTNAQVIAKEAFGPLLNVKIDFYTKVAEALEDPRIIASAQKFGASLVDIARAFERNAGSILKTVQGIVAGLAVLAGASALGGVIRTLASVGGAVKALRAGVIGLNLAVAANPFGALATAAAIGVAALVTFRDQITRALTPFESFKDLVAEVGPILSGAFDGVKSALGGVVSAIGSVASEFGKLTGISDVIASLGGGWGLVEKGITGASVALALYLGLNLAQSVATTINLAGAWRSVEKALKGAAGAQAIFSGASFGGAVAGAGRLAASIGGLAVNTGKALLSFTALRAGIAALGGLIASIPLAGWIIGGLTALVTFRKELSQVVTGSRDAGVGLQAVFNVLGEKIKTARALIREAFGGFDEFVIDLKIKGLDLAEKTLDGIKAGIADIRERFLALVPDGARQSIESLGSAFSSIVGSVQSFGKVIADNLAGPLKAVADIGASVGNALRSAFDGAAKFAERFNQGLKNLIDTLGIVKAFKFVNSEGGKFVVEVRQEAKRLERERAVSRGVAEFKREFGEAPIGIFKDPSIDAAQNAFHGLNKSARDYVTAIKSADAATKTFGGSAKKEIDGVRQSLQAGVAEAKRLADAAAKSGARGLERETEIIRQEREALQAVKEAQEKGEQLTLANALQLVRQRDELLQSAEAFVEAEKALRDRAESRASDIAQSVEKQIDRSLSRSSVDLGSLDARGLQVALAQFERSIEDQLDFLSSDATIGLDADTLLDMQEKIKDAHAEGVAAFGEEWKRRTLDFKATLQNVFGSIFDDLLFNGGRGLGDMFRNALRSIGNSVFSDPISKALSGNGNILGNLKDSFKGLTDGFARAGKSVAGSISKSLAGAGQALGAALGGALAGFSVGNGLGDLLGLTKGSTGRRTLTGAATGAGLGAAVGSVVPGIGTAIGAAVGAIAGAIGGALSGLFGRKTSTGVVDIASGTISATKNSKKEGGARNERRDAILSSVSEAAKALADALGATVTRGFQLQVEAGKKSIVTTLRDQFGNVVGKTTSGKEDVQGAFNAALKLVIDKAFSGGNQTLRDFANSALAAGQSLESVISVLQVLKQASETGVKALADYALAAARAGRSADQIAEGVNALNAVYDLAKEPLSDIAQQIKNIDDAINPVIADLRSLGQSFAEVAKIGKDAGIALGRNFLDSIKELNLDLQNTVFGQFNRLLETIRKRENDAKALFDRGFITQQQLGFVQSTSGLEVSKFFQNLSDDDKESLADFLGLLRTASGDVAVARVKLEEQFGYLIDNVEETAQGFEEAARNFERLGQNLRQTADSIRTEFSGATPRADVTTLSGRVSSLLETIRDSGATNQSRQSALEALPQVVTSLVNAARQAFGGTEQFARIRDFGLSALDEAGTISEQLARQNQSQAEAARADVKILTDIRELLNDDKQLPTLQNILNEGKITNSLIAQQIQAFLTLMSSAGSNLNQITAEQLQAAAAAYLSQQQQQIAAQTPAPSSTSASPSPASPSSQSLLTNEQAAQIIADNSTAISRLASSNNAMALRIEDMSREISRLATALRAA